MIYSRIIDFRFGSKDSADEKYLQVLKWLVEQEISFDMICNNGSRTLRALFYSKDDIKRFNREFTKKGIWLE